MRSEMTHHKIACVVSCLAVVGLLGWRAFPPTPANKPNLANRSVPFASATSELQEARILPAVLPTPLQPLKLAFSPSAIKRYANHKSELDLMPLWQRLDISAAMKTLWADQRTFERCGLCQADLYRLELDSQAGAEMLLAIRGAGGETRYLIFKRNERSAQKWQLLGHVDHVSPRIGMTQHKVVVGRGKRWLVIQGQTGAGSGFSEFYERWYEVNRKGVREVLQVLASGSEFGPCDFPGRKIASRFLKHTVEKDGADVLGIEFSVTWTAHCVNNMNGQSLWRERAVAAYAKKQNESVFSFNPRRSKVSPEKLKAIFTLTGPNNEEFVRYNYERLSKLAKVKNAELREWLLLLLEGAKDIPEKRRLLSELKPQP
jgi:hypothetical protein